MGERYRHLSIEERCELARLRAAVHSVRQIAAALDRSPSTISRQLRRNDSSTKGYHPVYAGQQAWARRWIGSRLDRMAGLRQQVLSRLQQGLSPEQVAGRLALESGNPVISHESIYRFIYAQIRRTKNYNWRHLLPRGKSNQGASRNEAGADAGEAVLPLSSSIASRCPIVPRQQMTAGLPATGRRT